MGNSPLSGDFSSRRLSLDEREAMKKFCEDEIQLLRETFKGLADAKNGRTVDKETFLKCFPLPGLLGERLFEVIDRDGSGSIQYNEFIYGLAILFRGTRTEKLKFIFDLYDFTGVGSISRREFTTMLNQFPRSALVQLHSKDEVGTVAAAPSPSTAASASAPPPAPGQTSSSDEIEALVNLAFPDASATRLTFHQFSHWCENTPNITNFLMSILPGEEINSTAVVPLETGVAALCDSCPVRKQRKNSLSSLHPARSSTRVNAASTLRDRDAAQLDKTHRLLLDAKQACPIESIAIKIQDVLTEIEREQQITRDALAALQSLESCDVSEVEEDGTISGDLWKRGARLRQMTKRHFVLHDNFLYCYGIKQDAAPRSVTFMCGCYIESSPQQHVLVEKGVQYFGIDIVPEPGSNRETRTVYTKSLAEQAKWVSALRRATDKVSIDEFYSIGAPLGHGRFSIVCEATHKQTGAKHAVKIIDKSKLIVTEKELLRTEIAILKLVTHRNIIRLQDVYEDKQHIYIVTELATGGDLFSRIDRRARFTESEARMIMQPLLECMQYLHRLGIVHRDIKPENILCGDKLNDLKIADFGLSKLVHPEEIMKMPCGTLNYVAPEVLSLVGYGQEADIWSVGVIMYLLLRGELPFFSKTKNEIIQKTLHADINLDADAAWLSISPSGKSMLKGLLTKDPAKRLTAEQALAHEWFIVRMPRADSIHAAAVATAVPSGAFAAPPSASAYPSSPAACAPASATSSPSASPPSSPSPSVAALEPPLPIKEP